MDEQIRIAICHGSKADVSVECVVDSPALARHIARPVEANAPRGACRRRQRGRAKRTSLRGGAYCGVNVFKSDSVMNLLVGFQPDNSEASCPVRAGREWGWGSELFRVTEILSRCDFD